MLSAIFRISNTYRLDVYLLFILFLFSLWRQLPIQWGGLNDPRVIVGFSFLLGLIWIYLFNKKCDEIEDSISQPDEMVGAQSQRVLNWALPIIVLAPVVLLFVYNLPIWPYLLYVAIGTAYSYPLYRGIRLKNIFLVKTIVAGIDMLSPLWYGLFVYLPVFYQHAYTPSIAQLVALFMLYSIGELIWDIRDVEGDRVSGVHTLPVVLGVRATKYIAAILLGSVLLLPSLWVNYAAFVTLGACIIYAQPNRPRWFFHAMLYLIGLILVGYIVWG